MRSLWHFALLGSVASVDDPAATKRTGATPEQWALYSGKVAKNSGQCGCLSAREIEHGRFRALFAGVFWPKMQVALSSQHSARRKPRSNAFHRKARRGRKGRGRFTADRLG